jgi:hypothetical protein
MQDSELRDMLTEIRIIRDEGNHTTMNGLPFLTDAELESPQVLDAVTITHVLPKKYPTGTLTFEHTFPQNGKFIGIVTVENGRGQIYVTQFPFSVGQGVGKSMGIYASSALGLLEKTDWYRILSSLLIAGGIAIAAVFLMKDRTEPSIRVQQGEQKREKEEAEAAARERQRQQEEQYRRHDSSSGKMSADHALEILGLKSGATEEEIRAAYNRLMKRVHPDVGGSSVFAKQLNRARDVLIE